MNNVLISALVAFLLIGGAWYFAATKQTGVPPGVDVALAAKFDTLSKNGNSSCSANFTDSIESMPDTGRLQGSCCSPMDLHRYSEQVEGLEKFKDIPEIPSDPYDIDAVLAKQLKAYYDVELTSD